MSVQNFNIIIHLKSGGKQKTIKKTFLLKREITLRT